ncbi:hypothetical protein GGR53DRAFT_526977 [Hypoxylon sp. FL1150]|nr:hypothetical protein GGR53DRAFT_526977 [Hypoxylon sp. FL1150]
MLADWVPSLLSVGRAGADALWECVCENMKDYWRTRKIKLTWTIVLKKVFGAMAARVGELLAPRIVELLRDKPWERLFALFHGSKEPDSIEGGSIDPPSIRPPANTGSIRPPANTGSIRLPANTGLSTAVQPGFFPSLSSRVRFLDMATRCQMIPPPSTLNNPSP